MQNNLSLYMKNIFLRIYFIVYFLLFLISFYTLVFAHFYVANFLLFLYCILNCSIIILIWKNRVVKEFLLALAILNIVQCFNFTVFGFNYNLLFGPELSLIFDFELDKIFSINFSPLFINFELNFIKDPSSMFLVVNLLHLCAGLAFLRIKQKVIRLKS